MPCNSDYLDPDEYEREISHVACLLDELRGLKWSRSHWNGFYPGVYNRADKALGDRLVSELCSKLSSVDVTKYSLEMQMWWRDHQAADAARKK